MPSQVLKSLFRSVTEPYLVFSFLRSGLVLVVLRPKAKMSCGRSEEWSARSCLKNLPSISWAVTEKLCPVCDWLLARCQSHTTDSFNIHETEVMLMSLSVTDTVTDTVKWTRLIGGRFVDVDDMFKRVLRDWHSCLEQYFIVTSPMEDHSNHWLVGWLTMIGG